MELREENIELIVKQVLSNLKSIKNDKLQKTNALGMFEDINDAIAAAKETEKIVKVMSIEKRETIIKRIREKTIDNAKALAELGVEETGMGRVDHKILKHELIARKTPGTEDIKTTAWSGDRGLTLVEMGPFGVIGSITPSTNPSETIICNSIGMIAAGNTVVFNPHPSAIKVSMLAIKIVNEA